MLPPSHLHGELLLDKCPARVALQHVQVAQGLLPDGAAGGNARLHHGEQELGFRLQREEEQVRGGWGCRGPRPPPSWRAETQLLPAEGGGTRGGLAGSGKGMGGLAGSGGSSRCHCSFRQQLQSNMEDSHALHGYIISGTSRPDTELLPSPHPRVEEARVTRLPQGLLVGLPNYAVLRQCVALVGLPFY